MVQDLSPIDVLPACFIAFLCRIHGQLMVQPVFRGDKGSGRRKNATKQENGVMDFTVNCQGNDDDGRPFES